MTGAITLTPLPDHTQLPDEDGSFVKNFQEHRNNGRYEQLAANKRGH
nr:hypothetical protein [Spirulina major]